MTEVRVNVNLLITNLKLDSRHVQVLRYVVRNIMSMQGRIQGSVARP